jgi:hypothetical protein
VAAIPEVCELTSATLLVGEAIFTGLETAVTGCESPWTAAGSEPRVIIGIGSDLTDIRRIQGSLDPLRRAIHRRIFTD